MTRGACWRPEALTGPGLDYPSVNKLKRSPSVPYNAFCMIMNAWPSLLLLNVTSKELTFVRKLAFFVRSLANFLKRRRSVNAAQVHVNRNLSRSLPKVLTCGLLDLHITFPFFSFRNNFRRSLFDFCVVTLWFLKVLSGADETRPKTPKQKRKAVIKLVRHASLFQKEKTFRSAGCGMLLKY